jgi:hypothetical protein
MQHAQGPFDIWPKYIELASDLNVKPDKVRKWFKFRRIPPDSWPDVIAAAARRGKQLTIEQMLASSAPMKPRGRPAHKSRRARRSRAEARAS